MNKVLLVVDTICLSMVQACEICNDTEIETVNYQHLSLFQTNLSNSKEPLSFKDLKINVLYLICERRKTLKEKIQWIYEAISHKVDFEPLISWRPSYEYLKRDNERLLKEHEECSKKKAEWLKDKEKLLNERDASYEQLVHFQQTLLEDEKQWLKEKKEYEEWYPGSHNESMEVLTSAPGGPSYEQLKQENIKLVYQEKDWIREELECLEEKNSLLRLSDTLVLTREQKETMLESIRDINDSSFSV